MEVAGSGRPGRAPRNGPAAGMAPRCLRYRYFLPGLPDSPAGPDGRDQHGPALHRPAFRCCSRLPSFSCVYRNSRGDRIVVLGVGPVLPCPAPPSGRPAHPARPDVRVGGCLRRSPASAPTTPPPTASGPPALPEPAEPTPPDHDQPENPEDAHAHATSHGDDAEALARWLTETLAEAPPVPKAATTLIAGVLVRRPPPPRLPGRKRRRPRTSA